MWAKIEIGEYNYFVSQRIDMTCAIVHYKHETKDGELNITFNPKPCEEASDDTGEDPYMLKLVFEDGETGAFYEASFQHAELCVYCTVFYMRDEIPDIISEMPVMMKDIISPYWAGPCARAAGFKYKTNKGREYQIILPLWPRVYSSIDALKQENVTQQKKIAALEKRIVELESICKEIRLHCDLQRMDMQTCVSETIIACDRTFHLPYSDPRMISREYWEAFRSRLMIARR